VHRLHYTVTAAVISTKISAWSKALPSTRIWFSAQTTVICMWWQPTRLDASISVAMLLAECVRQQCSSPKWPIMCRVER